MAQESNSDPVPPTPPPVTVNTTLPSTSSSSKLPPLTTTTPSGSGGTSSRSSPSPVNASSPSHHESPHDMLKIKNHPFGSTSSISSEIDKVQPKRPLKDKADLLYLIRTPSHVEGLLVEEIQYDYPTVMDDLASLKAENLISILGDVVYPNDPRFISRTDQDVKEAYRAIDLPDDLEDLDRELRRNRITPTPKSDEKRVAAQRRAAAKRRAESKRRK